MHKIKSVIVLVLGLAAAKTMAVTTPPTTFKLNFKITAMTQGLQNAGSPIEKSTIERRKIANQDIIGLLEQHYGPLGDGATLALDLSGDFVVLDADGFIIEDPTTDGLMNNFFDSEGEMISEGTFNEHTAKGSGTSFHTAEIVYDDDANGIVFTIHGLEAIHEKFDENTAKFTESIDFTGQGDGEVDFDFVVLSGSMSGHASGVSI
jgi:hypothetical protein